ncbi:WD40 repeat-like protein [Microstroma glucosiphilum]|uniref:WD40 repeat-like protein n=1 Tax=Pseudomicrostroma glucosiphilum TaxID=1684307 RepID=A0A316U8V1_9BASI|nr:WD40 repeat-like protein [Pseudomicrostroma glucosiphilum]PWN20803.1 WD40 repeat-like protein [Pseudomicrostroma glucosiphilum]
MISSLVWVRKGSAARQPRRFNITDEAELERVQKLTSLEFGDAQSQLEEAKKEALLMGQQQGEDGDEVADGEEEVNESHWVDTKNQDQSMDEDGDTTPAPPTHEADDLAKYNLDTYDEEESKGMAMGAFSNIRGLQFYKSNDEDPYITLKDDAEDENEEREALEVLPTDNLVISAKTEDEVSMIEAYVYANAEADETEASGSASLYVHHDLLLPSFPLCLEWVGQCGSSAPSSAKTGNYLAVSTMEPEVEVWDMDVIDALVPDVVLGDRAASKDWEKQAKKKGTGKKKKRIAATRPISPLHHTDAVLSISWNTFAPNLLVTSSADTTIKLWDLNTAPAEHGGLNAIRSFEVHQDKVQSVAWNTSGTAVPEAVESDSNPRSVLASGGYDGFVKVWDVRTPDKVTSIKVSGEVEKLKWNPWKAGQLLVALDTGLVQAYNVFDPSKATSPIWTLSAHQTACTSLDVSVQIQGCLLTAGLDRTVKLWNIEEDSSTLPSKNKRAITLVTSRDLEAGKIFTASFSPDEPLTIAAGGSGGEVKVWDALAAKGVAGVFGARIREWAKRTGEKERAIREGEDRLVEVEPDEDDDDEDDEQEEGGAVAGMDTPVAAMEE